jgi:hypothetical protein
MAWSAGGFAWSLGFEACVGGYGWGGIGKERERRERKGKEEKGKDVRYV